MSAATAKQTLQKLCAENKNTIGEMVRLLTELNAELKAAGDAPQGYCYPCDGGPVQLLTQAQCRSVPGVWSGRSAVDVEAMIEQLVRKLPPKGQELHRLSRANMPMVQQLLEALREANTDNPPEPIGISRLADGRCAPATEKESKASGGTWSPIAWITVNYCPT